MCDSRVVYSGETKVVSEVPSKAVVRHDLGIFSEMKDAGDKIVMLALYTEGQARIAEPYADIVLVGDSAAMTMYGHESTQTATMKMQVHHGKSVVKGMPSKPVIVDMPIHTYDTVEQAYRNASIIMERTGCAGVKLEGGRRMAGTIAYLVHRGIPVCAHIGLTPQDFPPGSKYKIAGRGPTGAQDMLADAQAVQEAGAFMYVIEGTILPVARLVASKVQIPSIGIGAAPECDGQVLVWHDVMGLTKRPPTFAQSFANHKIKKRADIVAAYAQAVRGGSFPDAEKHCYPPKEGDYGLAKVYG